MKWKQSRRSSNVEDRRGQRGRLSQTEYNEYLVCLQREFMGRLITVQIVLDHLLQQLVSLPQPGEAGFPYFT